MPKFKKLWRCWSCGASLPDGTLLDCFPCSEMLHWAEVTWKLKHPEDAKMKHIHILRYKGKPWYWDRKVGHERFDSGKPRT